MGKSKRKIRTSSKKITIDDEVIQYWLNRLPTYQNSLIKIKQMGLPILDNEQIDTNLLQKLKNNPKDSTILAQTISIKVEGCSKNFHKIKLGMICLKYVSSLIGYEPIEIEQMVEIIHSISVQKHTKMKQEQILLQFDDKFLQFIGYDNISFHQRFLSTSLNGYYEIREIDMLKGYGTVEQFQKARQLRLMVIALIEQFEEVIHSINLKNEDLIEQEFCKYLELKKIPLPFTKQNQVIPEVFEEQKIKEIQSNNVINSKQEKISIFLVQRKMRKSNQEQQKLVKQEKIWSQEQKEQFESLINKVKTIRLQDLVDTQQKQQQQQQQQQPKFRSVTFEAFDSDKTLDKHTLRMQYPIYSRRPFHKYEFIQYELDSDEEMQHLFGEELSSCCDDTESSESMSQSIDDFIENIEENKYQTELSTLEERKEYQLILNPQDKESIQQFDFFRCIKLSENNKPIIKKEHKSAMKERLVNEIAQFASGRQGSRRKIASEFLKQYPELNISFIEHRLKQICFKSINKEWQIKEEYGMKQDEQDFLKQGINLFNKI